MGDKAMDWHGLMSTLASQASDLELLQLRCALDHLMLQPNRIMAIRRHLHVGQEVAKIPGGATNKQYATKTTSTLLTFASLGRA